MVTARSTKWPDNLGQSASYVLHVCKGATGSAANVINSAGATAGAASNHPYFTLALKTARNQLEVTPVGSTSGVFVFTVVTFGERKSVGSGRSVSVRVDLGGRRGFTKK